MTLLGYHCLTVYQPFGLSVCYSKTPLLGPPLGLRKNGLYSGVVLLLMKKKSMKQNF